MYRNLSLWDPSLSKLQIKRSQSRTLHLTQPRKTRMQTSLALALLALKNLTECLLVALRKHSTVKWMRAAVKLLQMAKVETPMAKCPKTVCGPTRVKTSFSNKLASCRNRAPPITKKTMLGQSCIEV